MRKLRGLKCVCSKLYSLSYNNRCYHLLLSSNLSSDNSLLMELDPEDINWFFVSKEAVSSFTFNQ